MLGCSIFYKNASAPNEDSDQTTLDFSFQQSALSGKGCGLSLWHSLNFSSEDHNQTVRISLR